MLVQSSERVLGPVLATVDIQRPVPAALQPSHHLPAAPQGCAAHPSRAQGCWLLGAGWMGMVEKSDLLLLNGKAILFCGMRMCFALTFCGGISFCCLKRQRKENGLPEVTGKTSVIPTTSVLCSVLPLLLSLAPFPQPAALQSWKQGPAELCPFPGSSAAGWDLASSQAHPPEPICPGHTSPSGTAAL